MTLLSSKAFCPEFTSRVTTLTTKDPVSAPLAEESIGIRRLGLRKLFSTQVMEVDSRASNGTAIFSLLLAEPLLEQLVKVG